MSKIGMHIHSLQPEVYQSLVRLRPPGAIILNPTTQWIEDIRAVMGSQFYLGVRKHEDGVVFWERSAENWADAIAAMCGDALHLVDGAITYNEPLPQGHDNPEHFPLFDHWQARVIRRLQDVHGLDALAFPFGSGQFTAAADRVRLDVAFPESCEVCRTLAPHDYDWPDIWRSEGYRAMRWLAWLDDIEGAGHGRKEVIVSEWGLTQATYGGPDIGWRSGVSLDDYMQQMDEYNARMCGMPEVKFFAPFNWGGTQFGWGTFEHVPPGDFSVVDRIFMIVCPEVPPEPPPNGGNEMTEILDFENNPRDEQWLHDVWGVTIRRASPPAGQPYFKLVKVAIKEGACAIHNRVWNTDGSPMEGVLVAFHWPSAPDPPESGEWPHTTEVHPHDWKPNFVFGATGLTGDWAGAMGVGAMDVGAMVNEGGEGPHWDWIHHVVYHSDCVSGLGWRTGTNHRSPRLFWILTIGEDEPSPDPPEEGTLKLKEVLPLDHVRHSPPNRLCRPE